MAPQDGHRSELSNGEFRRINFLQGVNQDENFGGAVFSDGFLAWRRKGNRCRMAPQKAWFPTTSPSRREARTVFLYLFKRTPRAGQPGSPRFRIGAPIPGVQDDLIARLARQIDAAKQPAYFAVDGDHIAAIRGRGACEPHSICAEFVSSVNSQAFTCCLDLAGRAEPSWMLVSVSWNLFVKGGLQQLELLFENLRPV